MQWEDDSKSWTVLIGFFGSEDQDDYIKQDAEINLRIVNDDGEEVYKNSYTVILLSLLK